VKARGNRNLRVPTLARRIEREAGAAEKYQRRKVKTRKTKGKQDENTQQIIEFR
jgi:hypothetical protein